MSVFNGSTKLYWLLQLSGWIGMVCIELTNYTFFIIGKFDWTFVRLFGYGAFLGLTITHLFRLLIQRSTVFTWRPQNIWLTAFSSTVGMSVLINLLFYLPTIIQSKDIANNFSSVIDLLGGTINWMRYVGVWVILYFMYHILERTRKIEEEKLKSENLARLVELELLKTQLNPHFLFNALNSIKALVSIDQEQSKDAIVKLSELLRFTLNYENHALIPLNDELAQVKKYLSLEQIRFGNKLLIQYEIDDASLNRLIPPAVILTLAENAIKHGIAKKSGECILAVKTILVASNLVIEMINPGSLDIENDRGIGLQNIKKRLYHFFKDRATLSIAENKSNVLARLTIEQ